MSVDAGDGEGPAVALRAIYDELAACPDLRPGPTVDGAFRRLVRLVVDTPSEAAAAVLAHAAVRDVVDDLRSLCFEGEYQLEVAWARRIAESPDPVAELGRFPFVANYRQLHALERDAVARLAEGADGRRRPGRVAFVGSGPLPLTAFLLAGEGTRVDNLDRDPAALAASAAGRGCAGRDRTGLRPHGRRWRRQRRRRRGRGAAADLAAYGSVVLAALVGRTPDEKARVIAHLADAMAPGAVLVVRSARGLRTLLYPEVDPRALAGFDVLGTVHPDG